MRPDGRPGRARERKRPRGQLRRPIWGRGGEESEQRFKEDRRKEGGGVVWWGRPYGRDRPPSVLGQGGVRLRDGAVIGSRLRPPPHSTL